MENTSPLESNNADIDFLIKNRPKSYTWILWPQIRLWFFIVWGVGSFLYGFLVLTVSAGNMYVQSYASNQIQNGPNGEFNEAVTMPFLEKLFPVQITVGIEALVISGLCFGVAFMFRKIIKRNRYIQKLENACKGNS